LQLLKMFLTTLTTSLCWAQQVHTP
jgi:hypothetical protein